MIMKTFFVSWLLATPFQFWLGLRRILWIGWIVPTLFLIFAVYAWTELILVDIRVSVLITVCLPCIWLPSIFCLGVFYKKQKGG